MIFERGEILYGNGLCQKLEKAVVAVCGVGAVGGFAVEALARLGVGEFRLFDFDVFDQSNVNRQLCALTSTVGMVKVEVQKRRILDINPTAKVSTRNIFIDENSAREIFEPRPTVVVDAIDTISSKVLLAKLAQENSVALVASMGAARRKNPLEVKTADVFKTHACPFAARVRKELRAAGVSRGYKCVFSPEIPDASSHVSGAADKPADGGQAAPQKKVIGSSVIITGIFGLNLANLALEEISKAQ